MILITGASGNNGTEIVRLLSQQELRVRAMTRKQHDRNRASIDNVEFVTADFDDVESIRRALDSVEQTFLVTPSSERVEEQQLTFVENALNMASKFSEALGKQVNFVDIPESAMREALLGFGLPEWQAGLVEDYAHYRRGEAANVSTAVQEVTGHPARSFEGFARDYKEVLHD